MKQFIASAVLAMFSLVAEPCRGDVIAIYNPDTLTVALPVTNGAVGLVNTAPAPYAGTNNLTVGVFGPPQLYTSSSAGYDTVFNGHNYLSYNANQSQSDGLLTNALFSGNSPRTVAGVYDTPLYGTGIAPSGSFDALVAGQATVAGGGTWFALESRDNNAVGNPYLVNYGPDLSTNGSYPNVGHLPIAHELQFAVATYDGTTETLYWAYGTTGAVHSISVAADLNTNSNIFTEGSAPGEASSPIDIGAVIVLNSAIDAQDATAVIEGLQGYYSPEPSSIAALCGMGAMGLLLLARRRRVV